MKSVWAAALLAIFAAFLGALAVQATVVPDDWCSCMWYDTQHCAYGYGCLVAPYDCPAGNPSAASACAFPRVCLCANSTIHTGPDGSEEINCWPVAENRNICNQ